MFAGLWPEVPGGRGADRLGHQRRARPHLDLARDGRPARPPRAARLGRRAGRPTGPASTRPATTSCGGPLQQGRERLVAFVRQRLRESAPGAGLLGQRRGVDRRGARPRRAHHRLRPAVRHLQAGHAPAVPARPPAGPALRPRAAGAVRVRRQGPPRRPARQGDDPADPAVRRAARRAPPLRVPRRLRHGRRPRAVPGRRRLAQHPAAPAGGVRHQRHEGRAQRRAQLLDPRRLVGRVLRRHRTAGPSPRPRTSPTSTGGTSSRPRASSTCSRARSCRSSTTAARAAYPVGWVARVKDAYASLGPKVTASRMVRDYVQQLLRAGGRGQPTPPRWTARRRGRALAAWRARVDRRGRASRSPAWRPTAARPSSARSGPSR